MDVTEKKLREEIGELLDSMEVMNNLAEEEKRDFDDDEQAEYDELKANFDKLEKKLNRYLDLQKKKGDYTSEVIKNTIEPIVKVEDKRLESKEALMDNTAKIYRALYNPSIAASNKEKMLTEAVDALAKGGHYGEKMRNAVDAFTTLVDSDGGIFLPTSISDQIMNIAREYGVFAGQATRFPLSVGSGTVKIPNYTGTLSFHAVNEGNEVTASKFSFKGLELKDRKWMCLVPWTNELDAAAGAKLVPLVNAQLGEAWAGIIDDAFINGDGTSTYHNLKGFINRSDDAAAVEVRKTTAASGHDRLSEIDEDDLVNALLDLAPSVRMGAIYVMHPDWDIRLAKIKDDNGLPLYLSSGGLIAKNNGQWTINGKPVYFTEKMTNTDTASTKEDYALCFNPKYLAYGDAGAFMAEQLSEASIKDSSGTRIYLAAQDLKALKVKGFFDYEFSELTVSSGGSNLGAFTVLETNS